jgi:hypothetical protein
LFDGVAEFAAVVVFARSFGEEVAGPILHPGVIARGWRFGFCLGSGGGVASFGVRKGAVLAALGVAVSTEVRRFCGFRQATDVAIEVSICVHVVFRFRVIFAHCVDEFHCSVAGEHVLRTGADFVQGDGGRHREVRRRWTARSEGASGL